MNKQILPRPYVNTKDMTDDEWWEFVRDGEVQRLTLADEGRPVHPAISFALGVLVGALFSVAVMGGLFS